MSFILNRGRAVASQHNNQQQKEGFVATYQDVAAA